MTKKEREAIKAAAAEKYNGDLDVAIAAHLLGDIVITTSGGKVPAGADLGRIAEIRGAVEADAPVPAVETVPDSITPREDELNGEMPAGDPKRPDKANLAKHKPKGDPERTDDVDPDDAPKADPKRSASANTKKPVGDPKRPDHKNEAPPEGDPPTNN